MRKPSVILERLSPPLQCESMVTIADSLETAGQLVGVRHTETLL